MNESDGGPADAAVDSTDTPGGLLRAERERRGYSVQYAAEDLHLDVWVIEALEAEGVAVALTEVFQQVRDDMHHVQRRLIRGDVGKVTLIIQADVMDTFRDMIMALRKSRQDSGGAGDTPTGG